MYIILKEVIFGVCVDLYHTHKLTELTANVSVSPVDVLIPDMFTIQAPQPPSRHINFVPVNRRLLRRNVFNEVSMGTVAALTNGHQRENNKQII